MAAYADPDSIYEMNDWIEMSVADIKHYPEQSVGMPRKAYGATFIYSYTHELAVGPAHDIHTNLIVKHGERLFPGIWEGQSVPYHQRPDPANAFRRTKAEQFSLLGRIGPAMPGYKIDVLRSKYSLAKIWQRAKDKVKTVVSFWNETPEIYEELLAPCMLALEEQGLVPAGSYISTPLMGAVPLDKTEQGGVDTKSMAAATHDTAELRRRKELHLMRPADKRAALQSMGATPKGQHPWQQQPGQKWWAMSSESEIRRIASMITEDPDVFTSGGPQVC